MKTCIDSGIISYSHSCLNTPHTYISVTIQTCFGPNSGLTDDNGNYTLVRFTQGLIPAVTQIAAAMLKLAFKLLYLHLRSIYIPSRHTWDRTCNLHKSLRESGKCIILHVAQLEKQSRQMYCSSCWLRVGIAAVPLDLMQFTGLTLMPCSRGCACSATVR